MVVEKAARKESENNRRRMCWKRIDKKDKAIPVTGRGGP
jgi:hypothetical protein